MLLSAISMIFVLNIIPHAMNVLFLSRHFEVHFTAFKHEYRLPFNKLLIGNDRPCMHPCLAIWLIPLSFLYLAKHLGHTFIADAGAIPTDAMSGTVLRQTDNSCNLLDNGCYLINRWIAFCDVGRNRFEKTKILDFGNLIISPRHVTSHLKSRKNDNAQIMNESTNIIKERKMNEQTIKLRNEQMRE